MVRSSGPATRKLPLFLIACEKNIRREAGYRIIKWKLLVEFPPDNPAWETAQVNCLAKTIAISTLRVRDL